MSVVLNDNAFGWNSLDDQNSVESEFRHLVSEILDSEYDGCLTFIYDESSHALRPGPGFDAIPKEVHPVFPYMGTDADFVGQSLVERRLVVVDDVEAHPSLGAFDTVLRIVCARSLWIVPVVLDGRIFGLFAVYHKTKLKIHKTDERLLSLMAVNLAKTLQYSETLSMKVRYEQLFLHHPFGMMRLDRNDIIVEINEALTTFLGDTKRTFIGMDFTRFLTRLGVTPDEIRWNTSDHLLIRDVHGQSRNILWLTVPIKEDDRIHGRFVVMRDITDFLDMQHELRTTQSMLTSFVGNSADAIMVIDVNGTLMEVNPAFERIFGWKSDEVVNLYVQDLAGIDLSLVRRQLSDGDDNALCFYETRARDKYNHTVDVDVAIHAIRHNGILSGFVAVVRNISVRKEAENQLRKSEKRYQSLLHQNPNGIVAVNLKGEIVEVNQAFERLVGFTLRDRHQVNHITDIVPTPYHGEIRSWLLWNHAGTLDREIKPLEMELVHRRGHTVPVAVTRVPMVTSAGTMEGYFFIVEDLTERKRAEEIFRLSDKLSGVGQLAAGVAHEIRNPLTAIRGFCRLMEEGSTPTQMRYLQIVQSELSRIELIVGEMMALAKPAVAVFRSEIVRNIIEEVVTLMNAEALLHNVSIQLDLPKAPVIIQCDVNQMKQVLVNIIKNAVEAFHESGVIRITLRSKEDFIEISVEDNGPGIPEEDLELLGKPFFTTKEKGTGLGLLVSRRIVQAHGGTLHVRSKLAEGTTVLLRLPLNFEPAMDEND
ncbi:PAS domain S-box protein [Alicyclobacillus dauci]|uniref:histidine kinase n=1 Tax=Alicyclobacillus dauci TaxID=1475485 RepID=A0ABY6Z1T8_9BACL|nr:PAS domain S-box protein [Alicyclobacillus dauci]WAH35945.1 PAS domain S-box protein [Alicyclobacillus dauci]